MYQSPAVSPLNDVQPGLSPVRLPRFTLSSTPTRDLLNRNSSQPRIAMVSTHGYVAAASPLGAADTGGQVVYVIELSKKLAQLGYEVDIWTRRFEDQPELEFVSDRHPDP